MSPRAGIIAGKSVIVVQVQDSVDAALKRISSNLNKFSAKVNRLGFEMFSGGFLGSLGLTALAKQFEDFEDKILFLSTKLIATEAELAGVEKTIRQLGRTTSFTASQVADAATILAQAGFNAAQVTKLLQPTLDLARGAQIDLASSGAILANTLRSFSLEADKATEVASQFIAAARLGTLDVLDLKESIKEVLGTVRNLNIDLPTTLALITQLAERSLKGTKAGTSLNTALLQLASKGKQLAKLGLVLPENIDGPGFIKFLEDLYKNINKLGNLKRTAVLQSIFNIRGGRAITALDDIKKIIDLQKQIAAAGDEARKAAVKMDSGFGGAIRRASSAIEGLTLRWGKLLADAIIPTLDLVPALSLALEQLTKANQTLVTGLILSPVAILGLGAGLLVASFAAAKLAGVIGLLAGSLKIVGNFLFAPVDKNGKGGVITNQLTNIAIAADRLKRSLRGIDQGLSAALLTPQLVGGRGRNARKIKPTSFFGRVGKTTVSLSGIARGIAGIRTSLANLWSRGLQLVIGGFRAIARMDLVRVFLNGSKAVWSLTKAFGALAAIGFKTLTTLSGWGNILTFLIIFGPKIKFIREAFTRLGSGIRSAFEAIGSIATAVGPAFSLIGKSMKTLLAGEGDLGFQQLSTALSAIVDIVGNKLSEAWNHLTLAIAPAYDFMVKLVSSTAELGKLFASTFGASLGNTLSNLANLFQGGGLGGGIGEMIRSVFEAIDMKGIFEGIGLAIVGMASSVNDTMKLIYNAIAQTMRDLRIAMIAFLGVLPSNKSNDFAPRQAMEKLAGQKFLRFNPSTGQFEEIAENFYQFDLKVTRANQSFDGFTGKLDEFLKTFKDGLTAIFTTPALSWEKIQALNVNSVKAFVQQVNLAGANADAGKKAQQRVNKLTSPNPTILGSLAVQDRRSPVQKLQEEMTKLRKDLIHQNSLTDLIGMNRTRDKRISGMREKLADIRARIKEELKAQRQMPISAPQRAVLSDIVSSTTGSFQQTRRNLVKLASGQSVEQKSLTALEQIQVNTSATTGNLDHILDFGLPVTMGLK